MRYFIVIHIENEILRTIIDGIRLFADPLQKHAAHITVRGPYTGKKESTSNPNIPRWETEIRNTHIVVSGVDTFFNTAQSTVFFKCESAELKEIWWKKNFKGFNPHITIYDKSDRNFAVSILDVLGKENINFKFKVKSLDKLITQSKKYPKTQSNLFEFNRLSTLINYDLLSSVVGLSINKNNVNEMTKIERLNYIEYLGKHLKNISDEELISYSTIQMFNKLATH